MDELRVLLCLYMKCNGFIFGKIRSGSPESQNKKFRIGQYPTFLTILIHICKIMVESHRSLSTVLRVLTYLGYLVVDLHWSRWVLSGDVLGQCCLRTYVASVCGCKHSISVPSVGIFEGINRH